VNLIAGKICSIFVQSQISAWSLWTQKAHTPLIMHHASFYDIFSLNIFLIFSIKLGFFKGLVYRLGKWVIQEDAAALILKKWVKKLQKFIRGRAQRQKCSATLAPIQVLALLIFLKSANSLLWVKSFTENPFLSVFASIPTVLETLGSICSSEW